MAREKKGLRQLAEQTVVAYVRMASTVVIAVVIRLCLDCIGIIVTDQEPIAANFWFAHCRKDGLCVLAGIALFLATLVGCSVFAWSCQDWITDPERNPYARRFSFAVILEAATWIPISVSVGKTNALVEWFMDISKDDLVQALLSSVVAVLLTISCALLTHVIMTRCRAVQGVASVREAGLSGFGKFFLLATLYCLGWAVAWSNWELVLSLMDALEPGRSIHNAMLAAGVISLAFILSLCFYLRYGPEPIIPDPQLQQVCYNHGYSSSIRRSLVSYVVYSCVVFCVMSLADPSYGLIIAVARKFYASSYTVFDVKALVVLGALACAVTLLSALCSAAITWAMDVDECTSMKLSRSVHDSCQQMVKHRRSTFDDVLMQVLRDGSDAQLAEAMRPLDSDGARAADALEGGPRDREGVDRFALEVSVPQRPHLHSALFDEDVEEEPLSPGITPPPRCRYLEMDVGLDPHMDIDSERQLRLSPVRINSALCVSVLTYDVLGFVVCFQWGSLAIRVYSVLFGRLASVHDALYMLSVLLYAAVVVLGLSRFVFSFFPSAEELAAAPPRPAPGPLLLSTAFGGGAAADDGFGGKGSARSCSFADGGMQKQARGWRGLAPPGVHRWLRVNGW